MANASENRSYEEQWRKAFEEAEMPPSPQVWKHIDQQLAAQEGGKYKRGFFFYRAVAASLLLCIAGLCWYTFSRLDNTNSIANQQKIEIEQADEVTEENEVQDAENVPLPTDDTPITERSGTIDSKQNDSNEASAIKGPRSSEETTSSSVQKSGVASRKSIKQEVAAGSNLSAVTKENNAVSANDNVAEEKTAKTLIFPNEEVGPGEEVLLSVNHRVGRLAALPPDVVAPNAPTWIEGIKELFLVPQYREERGDKGAQEKRGPQFFAGLAMAPSYFDPNFQSQPRGVIASNALGVESLSPPNFASDENNFALRQGDTNSGTTTFVEDGLDNQSSLSLSYGFDFGVDLGEHWSIESGLDFQNFQTTTETRYTIADVQSGERYPLVVTNAQINSAALYNTTPIGNPREVDNQFQFISIPLQVGYNVRFSRLTLSLRPGVAANVFLGNRISSEQYTSSSISRASGSPFNSQYFSGMISGGVLYQFIKNYSLSMTPSYQFALTDLASTSASFSSQPQSFGVRLGFRYNF